MSDCKHNFVGTADGVHCTLCGARFTPEEYATQIHRPQQTEVKKPRRSGKKVTTHE